MTDSAQAWLQREVETYEQRAAGVSQTPHAEILKTIARAFGPVIRNVIDLKFKDLTEKVDAQLGNLRCELDGIKALAVGTLEKHENELEDVRGRIDSAKSELDTEIALAKSRIEGAQAMIADTTDQHGADIAALRRNVESIQSKSADAETLLLNLTQQAPDIEKRLQHVEGKAKHMVAYGGVWQPGEFQKGSCVTLGGSLWICKETTTEKPGTSEHWQLAVKKGKDAKSPYELAVKNGFHGTERQWLASLNGYRPTGTAEPRR